MKAIQTKFIGPSETRGARVKAWFKGNAATVSWDYGSEIVDNHAAAVLELVASLKWSGRLVGGTLPDESMAWVFVDGSVVAVVEVES
jgi:hypothetical protein